MTTGDKLLLICGKCGARPQPVSYLPAPRRFFRPNKRARDRVRVPATSPRSSDAASEGLFPQGAVAGGINEARSWRRRSRDVVLPRQLLLLGNCPGVGANALGGEGGRASLWAIDVSEGRGRRDVGALLLLSGIDEEGKGGMLLGRLGGVTLLLETEGNGVPPWGMARWRASE